MNEQLSTIDTLDLDRSASPSTKAIGISNEDLTTFKGAKFAMALKARATGMRSIVDNTAFASLKLADLKAGNKILKIRHRQPAADRDRLYYSSSLTNRSSERVRIDRFGSYIRQGKTLILHSLTGGCYDRQQFRAWYDVDGEWLEPSQTVIDRSGHSHPGTYWVYFGTTASGQSFSAGSAWKNGWW
jgi:hypothetical protein